MQMHHFIYLHKYIYSTFHIIVHTDHRPSTLRFDVLDIILGHLDLNL
jgi:hypothetical protein